jgi:hypothetical protein
MTVFLFFVLLEPFLGLSLSLLILGYNPNHIPLILLGITSTCVALIIMTSSLQSKYGLLQNSLYGLCSAAGCLVITACFVISIFSGGQRTVVWKDRNYRMG